MSTDWPWRVLADPAAAWAAQPTFVLGQLLFVALALLAGLHAWRSGAETRFIWVGALLAGTANDLIFMALPLVDNFWHAQGLVMLTPRLPLYIPCVYICFLYLPTVAARRWGLSRWRTVGLTGLAAVLFYAPFDIVGPPFLWWTWHDTDATLGARILGAPCSSTLWVLTFSGAFAGLVDWALRGVETVDRRMAVVGMGRLLALCTLLMMVQMTALQQVDGGSPGFGALAVGLVIYGLLAVRGARPVVPAASRSWLAWVVPAYFAVLLGLGVAGTPETHRSAGVHQPLGACEVTWVDITGLSRQRYLCVTDYEEPFSLSCPDRPGQDDTWYTVCGVADPERTAWVGGLTTVAALGALVFGLLFGSRRRRDAG